MTSVLLNPVTLNRGEALFVPAGTVHAYLQGVGVEIMANSDNVLRAGLTSKHVDVVELLDNVDCVAAPPSGSPPSRCSRRPGSSTRPWTTSSSRSRGSRTTDPPGCRAVVPGSWCAWRARSRSATQDGSQFLLTRGQSIFVPASDGALIGSGDGTVVQADVP